MVVAVRDIQVAGRIHREPHRRVEFGSGGRAIVARESLHSIACHRGHHPGRREFGNNLVSRICNEEVALRVEGNRRGKHQRQRRALGLGPGRSAKHKHHTDRRAITRNAFADRRC